MSKEETVINAAGRKVPRIVNGSAQVPFQGLGIFMPEGRKHGTSINSSISFPSGGDKRTASLKDALRKCGLKDGMTISTHHHFRNGDLLANQVFDAAHELKVKDLVWFPSASFPCHQRLIPYLEDGTIHHIEGSMNGPLDGSPLRGR